MYNILAAIGLITILAILFFLYLNSIDRKKEEEKDNYDLAKYSDKCENIEKNASSVDEVHKQIRQVLSDPKERLEAETRRRQYQKELDDLNEERHKEYVIKRTYSYKYESDVFDICVSAISTMRPRYITTMRSLIYSTTDRSWVMNI